MIDRYTKAVLTLIGVMLCVISIQLSFRDAIAQIQNCGSSAQTACFVTTQSLGYGDRKTWVNIVDIKN
ncbi:hypothetical protein [Mesorhizobium neociceri]|uniref:Uncharacterized protein n=1 Tax=Mesorhizobium neociceri TaxID=1307853 RepID=A0A838B804_9HYPH|nr:hypothetical protein [Mesorhizobium neociceri]MBA1142575.1 hypothetical protein [Mesorhizobium neociceri]